MKRSQFKISAPVLSASELDILCQNGVDEVYCSILTDKMKRNFTATDIISRRQGQIANIDNIEELRRIALKAKELGIKSILAVNMPYSKVLLRSIEKLIFDWQSFGGDAVVVSDPSLMEIIHKKFQIDIHVSVLTNVSNSYAVRFFQRFGARRFVIPRNLEITEIKELIKKCSKLEFEAIVMYDNCFFIDGLCRFYHGTYYNENYLINEKYSQLGKNSKNPTLSSIDLTYEGHGCTLFYETTDKEKFVFSNYQEAVLACGACFLYALQSAGVYYFKIAGRGNCLDKRIKAIRFIDRILKHSQVSSLNQGQIMLLYKSIFGENCNKLRCYYPDISVSKNK